MLLKLRVTKRMADVIRASLETPPAFRISNVPDHLSSRIHAVKEKHGFTSFNHALTGCILTGLYVMESSLPIERKLPDSE